MTAVRILNASLDTDDSGEIIIRGVLDPASLKFIRLDWYQREQGFSKTHTNEIVGAIHAGHSIPDITIGMRGARVESKRENKSETYIMHDRCYAIDGGQRLYAAAFALKENPGLRIRMGVKAYTNTTEESENAMFCKLGTTQVRISASVLLRNRKKRSRAAALLVGMTTHPDFALRGRIAWDQVKTVTELINGFTFAKVVGALHGHKGGALKSHRLDELLSALDLLVEAIGEESVTNNILRFFDGIDKAWSIRNLSSTRPLAPHMTDAFLRTAARLLSCYPDFWDGEGRDRNDFYFHERFVKRLKGFKLAEYVRSEHVHKDILYEILRKRMNLDPQGEELENELDDAA